MGLSGELLNKLDVGADLLIEGKAPPFGLGYAQQPELFKEHQDEIIAAIAAAVERASRNRLTARKLIPECVANPLPGNAYFAICPFGSPKGDMTRVSAKVIAFSLGQHEITRVSTLRVL